MQQWLRNPWGTKPDGTRRSFRELYFGEDDVPKKKTPMPKLAYNEIANVINKFKYSKEVTSPPRLTPDQKTIRDLTVIDMTNCIADRMAQWEPGFDREAFLTTALRSRP